MRWIGFGKVNTGVDMRVRRPVYRQILIVRCENSELFIFVQINIFGILAVYKGTKAVFTLQAIFIKIIIRGTGFKWR